MHDIAARTASDAPRLARLLLLGLALAALATGCEEGGEPPPVVPPPPPAPDTPDLLMTNFRKALDETNLQDYDHALGGAYLFLPLPQDLADLGLEPGEHLARVQEIAIALTMFSGASGATGAPGIMDIDVVLLEPESPWVASTNPLFPPPALEALYQVELHFKHANGYFRVSGQQKFWVMDEPDAESAHYYLVGQQDFTRNVPKTEGRSWGGLKGLYSR